MNTLTRELTYLEQNGGRGLTKAQRRRIKKKANRDGDPILGKQGRLKKRYEASDKAERKAKAKFIVEAIRQRRGY
jgi:hypothetical protein